MFILLSVFKNLDNADMDIGALTTTTSPTPVGGNIHVQTCGHHLHLRCWNSYLTSLRGAQRFNSDRFIFILLYYCMSYMVKISGIICILHYALSVCNSF